MSFKVPEQYRDPQYSTYADGNNGLFWIPGRSAREQMKVIASDGEGWEHVSVSKRYECPTWDQMCFIKNLFWDDQEDMAVQYHPPKSLYVNNHPYCLHLWRMVSDIPMPMPHPRLVGIKDP